MRRSLQAKLIISYLVVALITVLVVSIIVRSNSGQSLMNLVMEQQTTLMKENLQAYYTANGTLDGFVAAYLQSAPGGPGSAPSNGPGAQLKTDLLRGVHGLLDAGYHAMIPMQGYNVGDVVKVSAPNQLIEVDVDGKPIAYILPDTRNQFSFSAEEELYLRRTTLAIGLASGAGVLTAVITAILLSGRLLKPIRQLTQASKRMSSGDLDQRVPVVSQDELGQLTDTFNQMSANLAKADQERKRLTADITHDLSTPLQIISGYIEMLEEREVTLTPQRIEILKTEINHLSRLVGDLTMLSQVEGGGLAIQLLPVQPSALMERVFRAYQPIAARQDVKLTLDVPTSLPNILVDEGRMVQVLKNLLENALRYTPRGGTIRLSASANEKVQLRVTDSGLGIEAEDLPYVFDRFYRADKARQANSGKMGLGLAISKALVEAQGGSILAESPGKGLGTSIVVNFPKV
jgi:signal transduction histidine kinase